jgi:large subunit ribosomal protein L6
MRKELTYKTKIPTGVEVKLENKKLVIKGEKGEDSRLFHYPGMEIKIEDRHVILGCKVATKKEKSIIKVSLAHISNMLRGVKEGYVYKLKICSGHFPMTVEAKNNSIIINNFLGEKKPRIAKIIDSVEAKIDGDIVTIQSFNKEAAGQSAANIEKSTRISNRDRRIFQDGIFIIEKGGRKLE